MPENAQLRADLLALNESVGALAGKLDVQESLVRRNKRSIIFVMISLIFDVMLTVWLGIANHTLYESQTKIDTLQTKQVNDTGLNRDNQCALVNLFLQFEKSSTTNPTLTPQERQDRIDSYKVIHQIHDDLKCTS